MKKFQSINETMFANHVLSKQSMGFIIGAFAVDECTGGGVRLQGTATVGGVTYDKWNQWDSDTTHSDGSTTYTNYSLTWYARGVF